MSYLGSFFQNNKGNVALGFALLAIPITGAGAAALDYARVLSERSQVQDSIDSAILAGANETHKLIADGVQRTEAMRKGRKLARQFYTVNNAGKGISPRGRFSPTIKVNQGQVTGRATYQGALETTLLGIFGKTFVDYTLDSEVSISAPEFVQLHFVIDNSNSMGVGATTSDISRMAGSSLNCAFACHAPDDSTVWTTTTGTARAAGATLRIDVVKKSISDVLRVFSMQQQNMQVTASIHTFSNNLVTEIEPTNDIDAAVAAIEGIDISGDWSSGGTNFDFVVDQVENKIGRSGNGRAVSKAKRIVVLVTDGIASNIQYDRNGEDEVSNDPSFTPFEPIFNGMAGEKWTIQGFNDQTCRDLKRRLGAEVYTVNVEYVIPTVGTDDDDRFEIIGRELKPDIDRNLESCASTKANYFKVNSPDEIESAFSEIALGLSSRNLTLNK